jgi:hypothetical protein
MNDLNHPKVRALSRAVASELQIEPEFADFLLCEKKPECFRYWCDPPSDGWTCYVPERIDVAYPLWSCNANQTLLHVVGSVLSYAHGYHDAPEVIPISGTHQGLLADLFIKLYEDEVPENDLVTAATFSGFRFLHECIDFQQANGSDFMNWTELKRQFIRCIDERSSKPVGAADHRG